MHRFTDGEWLWSESLPHYVERHAVSLPEEFVNCMRPRGWRVPEIPERLFGPGGIRSEEDYTFWLAWTKQEQKRRWYCRWRLLFYRGADNCD